MDRYRYGLNRIAPATGAVVTLEQAKHNCSIDDDDHDTVLADLIAQATDYCQERTDVSLLTETWQMTLDAFPRAKWIDIPRWPLQSIESVTYIDTNGDSREIAPEQFAVRIDHNGRGRVALKNWAAWPTTARTPDAVAITFRSGWPAAANVPPQWSRIVLMLVTWWFEQREAGVVGTITGQAPFGVEALLRSAAGVSDVDDFDLLD